jgi:hypothetical protein
MVKNWRFQRGDCFKINEEKKCLKRRICPGLLANGERWGRGRYVLAGDPTRGAITTSPKTATRSDRNRHPPVVASRPLLCFVIPLGRRLALGFNFS